MGDRCCKSRRCMVRESRDVCAGNKVGELEILRICHPLIYTTTHHYEGISWGPVIPIALLSILGHVDMTIITHHTCANFGIPSMCNGLKSRWDQLKQKSPAIYINRCSVREEGPDRMMPKWSRVFLVLDILPEQVELSDSLGGGFWCFPGESWSPVETHVDTRIGCCQIAYPLQFGTKNLWHSDMLFYAAILDGSKAQPGTTPIAKEYLRRCWDYNF